MLYLPLFFVVQIILANLASYYSETSNDKDNDRSIASVAL